MPALLWVPVLAMLFSAALRDVLGWPRFLTRKRSSKTGRPISIVIPARDEEANIGTLLDSIAAQSLAPHEVIVMNDGSSDRTAAIAREKGARVIDSKPLPDGWKGKPWACQQGAGAATGEWLLFLDADTRLEPGAMEHLSPLTTRSRSAFSICPFHTIRRPYEELSAFFNVMMVAGVNAFGHRSASTRRTALFGQSLLISKSCYDEADGHRHVRGEILEHFHLARHLDARGIRCHCYLGKGTITMRMFPGGVADLWSSWKKGFTSGAQHVAPRALFCSSLWLTGAMLATVGVLLAFAPIASPAYRLTAAAAYLLYAFQCLRAFRLAGSFSPLNALAFPISLLFYQVLFFTALIERKLGVKTRWKGRHVD